MTFDPTKPVQTRNGRKARIICTDMKQDPWVIVALVTELDGVEAGCAFMADGVAQACPNGGGEGNDLINIPEMRWANIYPPGTDSRHAECYVYTTERAAIDNGSARSGRIACIPFAVGDGLDGDDA